MTVEGFNLVPLTDTFRGVGNLWGTIMSIATEILSLRRNRQSSVKTLIGAIEWYEVSATLHRHWAMLDAIDLVLTNVAAHAADALNETPTKIQETRRAVVPARRWWRRYYKGPAQQRRCSN